MMIEDEQKGYVLWQDPTNDKNYLSFRNGIMTAVHDGISGMSSADEVWINLTSTELVPYEVQVPPKFLQSKTNPRPDFMPKDVKALMDEIVGSESTAHNFGWDGDFFYTWRRQFRARDRQRMKVEELYTLLDGYNIDRGCIIRARTGVIEVSVHLMVEKHRK
jgi:hypothetical protein